MSSSVRVLRHAGPPRRRRRRAVLVVAAVGAVTLSVPLLAGAASAHVAVSSTDAEPGAEIAVLTFRVPNESPKASTVKLTVTLPVDQPVAEVQVQPVPGWTASVAARTLPAPTKVGDFTLTEVPASVTWTASSGGFGPGQFETFPLTIAPVPTTSMLVFTATQTYSDATVVRWNEPTPADGAEPEHPAPMLMLAAASGGAMDGGSSALPSPTSEAATPQISVTSSPQAAATSSDATPTSSVLALGLSAGAVVLGAAALIVALRRRPS